MLSALWEFLERFVFDPSVIDLVMWFPHLSWTELAISSATVFTWKYVSDRIERLIMYQIRLLLALGLMKLAVLVGPRARVLSIDVEPDTDAARSPTRLAEGGP